VFDGEDGRLLVVAMREVRVEGLKRLAFRDHMTRLPSLNSLFLSSDRIHINIHMSFYSSKKISHGNGLPYGMGVDCISFDGSDRFTGSDGAA
jgi:hypothetical protein